jgi:micrococcal nuclease
VTCSFTHDMFSATEMHVMTGAAFLVARLAGAAALSAGLAAAAAAAPCALETGSTHAVVRVLDSETLLLDDGQEVRLIGALAPKPDVLSADARDWPPVRAALGALEALVAGRTVTLRHEGRQRDRYGRILAQVFLSDGGADIWLQDWLVREGHARAYTLPGNTACLGALVAAEDAARAAQRGVWSRETYRVRSADDVAALLKLAGRFAIVEGRVAGVTRAQRTTYVNFGTDWRRDFTASLATAVVARTGDGPARVDALAGKRVRVRGWIERRNGPMIVLGSLEEIEVLDAVSEASRR